VKLFPDAPVTEHLFDAHITLAPPEVIGPSPYGQRSVHLVTGGTFEGPKLRGTFRTGGGDWLLSPSSHNELDVRATMETDDGALIYLWYRGVLKVDREIAARVIAGDEVDPASYYFRTSPRFETGSERYAWLNTLVTVGYGYYGAGKVGYRVFAVL
jgi:hypothetical protein